MNKDDPYNYKDSTKTIRIIIHQMNYLIFVFNLPYKVSSVISTLQTRLTEIEALAWNQEANKWPRQNLNTNLSAEPELLDTTQQHIV